MSSIVAKLRVALEGMYFPLIKLSIPVELGVYLAVGDKSQAKNFEPEAPSLNSKTVNIDT